MAEISTLNGYKIKDKKAIRYYDTVADMVADTTLKSGMRANTKGYYLANDGGCANYVIRDKVTEDIDNGGAILILDNNLVAEMLTNGEVNVLTWGVKKEDTTTQSNLNALLNYYNNGNISIYFPSGEYYLTETIFLPTNTKLRGDGGATILSWYGNADTYMIDIKRGNLYCMINDLNLDGKNSGYGIYDCDKSYSGENGVRSKIYNLVLDNMKLGIRASAMGSEFHNIICNGCRLYDNENSIGFFVDGTDNFFNSCRIYRFGLGLKITDNNNRFVTVKSCVNGSGAQINNGSGGYYNIDLQENYRDNLIVSNTNESTFLISNQNAGIDQNYLNGNDLQYSLMKIVKCRGLNILGSLGARTKLGDGSCGNEKYALYLDEDSTYILADLSYIYRFHPQTVLLDKPIFNVPESETNKIIINGEQITGSLTFEDANITSSSGTGSTQSVTRNNNVITVSLKSTAVLTNQLNMCMFQIDNMNDPSVFLINSDTVFLNRLAIQFANLTNNKYLTFEQGISVQPLVTKDGTGLLKVNFSGLTNILADHRSEIESYLEGEIERSSLILSGYALQYNNNEITINVADNS